MSQIDRDLRRRFRERLSTVIGDAFDLYEIADLTARDAGVAIAHELLHAFVKVCLIVNNDVPPTRETIDTIAASLTFLFEKERRKNEEEKER
jgi:Zn-dependent peptidase ImmA (M78 family)